MVANPAAISRLPDGGRLVALDALRGLAALGVAFHHIRGTDGIVATAWHGQLSLLVDFFFVLSGFVIAAAYSDRVAAGFPLARFALLRLGRIYPLHLAMVLVYIAFESALWLVTPAGGSTREAFTGSRDPALLPEVLLLVQALTRPGQDIWNVQSWTISVELWLYLLAALGWRWLGARAAAVGLALALAALFILQFAPSAGGGQFWALRGIAGFGLGMALWPLHRRFRASLASLAAAVATLAEAALLALLMALFATESGVGPIALVNAAIVLLFAQSRGLVSRMLGWAPFVWIGTISYSLYMVHGMVIGRAYDALAAIQRAFGWDLARAQMTGIDWLAGPAWQQNALAIVILAACLLPAWLAWRLVEFPARQWSRRQAARWGAGPAESAAPAI